MGQVGPGDRVGVAVSDWVSVWRVVSMMTPSRLHLHFNSAQRCPHEQLSSAQHIKHLTTAATTTELCWETGAQQIRPRHTIEIKANRSESRNKSKYQNETKCILTKFDARFVVKRGAATAPRSFKVVHKMFHDPKSEASRRIWTTSTKHNVRRATRCVCAIWHELSEERRGRQRKRVRECVAILLHSSSISCSTYAWPTLSYRTTLAII